MKNNNTKTILILIVIIIILACILLFKISNRNNTEKQNIAKSSYSKSELIDLIKSEDNKTNYEVEYTLNDIKYNKKYLNKKMRLEGTTSKEKTIVYIDFEKNTNTMIDEENKIAVIQKNYNFDENYMPDDMLKVIENPNCVIEKEEKISNRNAIVLNYNGTEEIGDQFLFNSNNSNYTDNKVDEINYNIKIWIDTETGLILQTIFKANDNELKTVYNLKLNSVAEADVIVPNLSQYEVTDVTSK